MTNPEAALTEHPPAARPTRPAFSRLAETTGWVALGALLVVLVPLFLCMPLTVDAAFYDLCARHVLRGGALERDFFYLPPPGMPWAVALVRSVLGPSSVALRLADLLIVSAVVWLLTRWLALLGLSRAGRVWAAVVMFAFYLSTTELCHCQPDTWMFLPALCALHLRRRQLAAARGADFSPRRAAARAVLEGACWGAACLVKPFVGLPGLLAWVVSAAVWRRSGPGWGRRLLADAAGLVVGGLLAGGVWQLWLASSGSWSAYWHTVADYRGDYYSQSWGWQARCRFLFTDLGPWAFLHALTIPVALFAVGAVLARAARPRLAPPDGRSAAFALLSALYLGWVVEANFIQMQLNYHLIPTVLLALALTAGVLGQRAAPRWGWPALVAFAAACFVWQPAGSPRRLAAWGRCWREGSSTEVRDRLGLDTPVELGTDWGDLEKVADYLRQQGVGEGELTCFNLSTVHLYLRLGVDPSTRFLLPETCARLLPRHRERILEEVRASGPRYVVTDMMATGLRREQAVAERPGDPLALPPEIPPEVARSWPYSDPVVFRAGRYYVHDGKAGQRKGLTAPAP